jgi:uncharacterized membrane protein HdeD (DUF308 family)
MNSNEILQWAGTTSFMGMYAVMSFFPELAPWNILAGFLGGVFYLVWSMRVRNVPQTVTNLIGVGICAAGLYRFWG